MCERGGDTGVACVEEAVMPVSTGVIPLAPFDSLVTGSCRREGPGVAHVQN